MKKILSFILVAVLCLGVFVACSPAEEQPAATLTDAKTYLLNMYKDSASDLTNDYDVVGKVIVSGVSFTVTWTVDVSEISIKASDKENFWTVDLPDTNKAEKKYVLTATIKDANGETATITLNKTLPVYEKVAGVVTNPVAETAYKLFFKQVNIGKTLFLTSQDTGKFIKSVVDPKQAPDFFVENVDGGVKIYTMVNGTKSYIVAAATLGDGGKVSKSITFGAEGSVFSYNKTINAWFTVIDNIKYCMGTYSTYDTVSISEDSYYTAENTGVEQFPVEFILKADGEAMAPSEGPDEPTELTSIPDAVAIGIAKEHNTYTVEKYLVKGKITSITGEQYGNMYIEDENGNSIYIYGLYSEDGSVRYDAMTQKPLVGDTITVMSIIGQYNDTPQLKNAWLMEIEAVTWTDAEMVAAEKSALTVNNGNPVQLNGDIALPTTGASHSTVTITWAVDAAYTGSAVVLDAATGKLTVTLQAAEETVKLIATIKSGDVTETKEFTLTIAAKPTTVPAVVDTPVVDTPYKFYNIQRNAGKILYLDGGVSGRYLTMTTDVTKAIDVYLEAATGGYRFYTLVDGAKQYIVVYANDEGKTSVKYDANGSSVYSYDATTFVWKTTLNENEVYLGTYQTFETVSASNVSYITAENTRVSQFPLELVTMVDLADCPHAYDNACDKVCNICEAERTPEDHKYDNACDKDCNVCGAERTPADHVYTNACDKDCDVCGAERIPADHVDADTDVKCDVCGADMPSNEEVERTHIDTVKNELTMIPTDVKADTTIDLPAKGTSYEDVTIVWSTNNACAVIAGGKVTFTLGDAEQTVSITATLTCGKTTDVEVFTVKVAPKSNFVEGQAYKLYLVQANLDKTLYFKGEMSGHYFATTESSAEAADVYVEIVDGGYKMYFKVGETKTYISVVKAVGSDGKDHINVVFDAETPTVYAYNAEYDTFTTVIEDETYYLGTYNSYTTISASKISFAATSFVSHLIIPVDPSTCSHQYVVTCSATCSLCGAANPNISHDYSDATCSAPKSCKNCNATEGDALGHNFEGGTCSRCGAEEGATLPADLEFASAENKADGDAYMAANYADWTYDGIIGQTYGGYLGFGRGTGASKNLVLKSSAISVNSAFSITAVIKGNGSNGVMTSTLTFELVDANGNVVATGVANGSSNAAITPGDAKDTTYNISFTLASGKTWADVSNLTITFAKETGNIGLKSLTFVK